MKNLINFIENYLHIDSRYYFVDSLGENHYRIDCEDFFLRVHLMPEKLLVVIERIKEDSSFLEINAVEIRSLSNFNALATAIEDFCIAAVCSHNQDFDTELVLAMNEEKNEIIATNLLLTAHQIAKHNLLMKNEKYDQYQADLGFSPKSAWFFECNIACASKNQARKLRKLSIKNSSKFPFHKQSASAFLYKAEQAQIAGASIY